MLYPKYELESVNLFCASVMPACSWVSFVIWLLWLGPLGWPFEINLSLVGCFRFVALKLIFLSSGGVVHPWR